MSVWKCRVAVGGLLALTGCIDAVTLARECVNAGGCGNVVDPPPGMVDASIRDASAMDAGLDAMPMPPSDAALVDDGGGLEAAVGEPPLRLGLLNGTFELTRGQPGGLALSVIEPIPIGANLIEPWAACRFGFSAQEKADSMLGSGAGDVTARDGKDFIEADLGIASLAGLRQDLPAPLQPGKRYAFRIDARAAVGASITLEFWGSNVDCAATTKLAALEMASEAWTSTCLSFVAPSALPQIMLMPVARGASSVNPARIFFDKLWDDPSCL